MAHLTQYVKTEKRRLTSAHRRTLNEKSDMADLQQAHKNKMDKTRHSRGLLEAQRSQRMD